MQNSTSLIQNHNSSKNENSNSNEEENISYSSSTNIDSGIIDKETETKLRGDAIGDTLYSESFVVKTLFKFKDFKWNKDFEDDLCFLWDMTLEKDVCEYLFRLSYPAIVSATLSNNEDNRFIEIVIGILANMLCADCEKNISTEEIDFIISFINNNDPLILIQVMRFIKSLVCIDNKTDFVNEEFMEKINFILANSMNDNLLVVTLDTLSKLSLDFKIDEFFLNGRLFNSALLAYQTLAKTEDFNFETQQTRAIVTHLVQLVSNFCVYVCASETNRLLCDIAKYLNVFLEEMIIIIKYYTLEEILLPIPEEFEFYFDAFSLIFPTLNVNYISDLFLNLFKIFEMCIQNDCNYYSILDVLFYLISVGNIDDIFNDLVHFKNKEICIKTMMEANCKEFDCSDKLHILSEKLLNSVL